MKEFQGEFEKSSTKIFNYEDIFNKTKGDWRAPYISRQLVKMHKCRKSIQQKRKTDRRLNDKKYDSPIIDGLGLVSKKFLSLILQCSIILLLLSLNTGTVIKKIWRKGEKSFENLRNKAREMGGKIYFPQRMTMNVLYLD